MSRADSSGDRLMDAEERYVRLGRLVETIPDLTALLPLPNDTLQWLGRVSSLLYDTVSADDQDAFKDAVKTIVGGSNPVYRLRSSRVATAILYRALAVAESAAPVSARGAFIPAGNVFDAMAAVGKILRAVSSDLLIIDPYMDERR